MHATPPDDPQPITINFNQLTAAIGVWEAESRRLNLHPIPPQSVDEVARASAAYLWHLLTHPL